MPHLFQTKDRTGKPHLRWRFQFTDWKGRRRTASGTTSRPETERQAVRVQARHDGIRRGEIPPPKESDKPRPFGDVIAEYMAWGRVQGGRGGRPWSPVHLRAKERHLGFWQEHLRAETIGQVSLRRVESALRELQEKGLPDRRPPALHCSKACRSKASKLRKRGQSPKARRAGRCIVCGQAVPRRKPRSAPLTGKSLQNYAEAIHSLCLWAARRGYLDADPLAHLSKFDITPQSHRRAPSAQEIAAILQHAASPAERLLYEVALCSGYREGELRALRVQDLDADGCTLPLAAEFTKSRKAARQPIPRALAAKLATGAEGKRRRDPLLDMPAQPLEQLYRTMARAGVPKWAPGGKLDFHALRTGFVTLVLEAGANVKEAQALARHSTPGLTVNTYGRARFDRLWQLAEAVGVAVLEPAESTTGAQRLAAGAEGLDVTALNMETSRASGEVTESGSIPSPGTTSRPNAPDGETPCPNFPKSRR